MKKCSFLITFAIAASTFIGTSHLAYADGSSDDEVLPPIVFLLLDTSGSMNEIFDEDTNNTRLTNTPWYVNAKIYKGFFQDSFSVTLEVKDLFDSAKSNFNLCSDAVQIQQKNFSPSRSVMLTLQYRFNTTRDRYRGTGAGNSEKSRF